MSKGCEGCFGYCCIGDISHPLIALNNADIKRIAHYLDIPEDRFRKDYISAVHEGYPTLPHIKFPGPCIFWTTGRCGVQKVKPAICRDTQPREMVGDVTCRMLNKMRAGV